MRRRLILVFLTALISVLSVSLTQAQCSHCYDVLEFDEFEGDVLDPLIWTDVSNGGEVLLSNYEAYSGVQSLLLHGSDLGLGGNGMVESVLDIGQYAGIHVCFRFWLYIHATGDEYGVTAMDLKDSNGTNMGQLRFRIDGNPHVEWSMELAGHPIEDLGIDFTLDTWHRVELMFDNTEGRLAAIFIDYADPVFVNTNPEAGSVIDKIRLIAVKQYHDHNYSYFDEFCFGKTLVIPTAEKSISEAKALFR